MPRKFELDSLQADLSAIDRLLQGRSQEDDPLGYRQYSHRKREIEERIRGISSTSETKAEIALFFGGRPVIGSRGISSEFASKTIGSFQNLVSKRFASAENARLATRGPIPQREQSGLLISDVVRGSFGFVLQEADAVPSLIDTQLKDIVAEIADLIYRFSAADTESLDSAYDGIDPRILGELKNFFTDLDEAGATVRMVEGERDFTLDADSVMRGRQRVDTMEIEVNADTEARGYLYILPANGRFNLMPENGGETMVGTISGELRGLVFDAGGKPKPEYIGQCVSAVLSEKVVKERGTRKYVSYTLTGVKPAH